MSSSHIAIMGASSLVGGPLILSLSKKGRKVIAVSRKRAAESTETVSWLQTDISAGGLPPELAQVKTAVSLAPVWVMADFLSKSRSSLERVVALSSTSVIAKAGSASSHEQKVVEKLWHGESSLMETCARQGIKWTIIRTAMIHGWGMDGNVAAIARFIGKFGFFPVVNHGAGRRAPVHARDVAQAVELALESPATQDKVYNICGGEVLTYMEMVGIIFETMKKKPRVVNIPKWLAKGGVRLVSMAPGFTHLDPELVERMEMDMTFDNAPAERDFGYRPGSFQPDVS